MNTTQVSTMVENYLKHYKLYDNGWRFKLSRGVRVLGTCSYSRRQIRISKHHIELGTDEEVIDTIKHEIAHAIVGPGYGHGDVWKAAARRLGAIPEYGKITKRQPKHNWEIVCGCCYRVIAKRYRKMGDDKLSTKYHPSCGPQSIGKLFFRSAI